MIEIFFWITAGLIFYAYLGYTLVLLVLNLITLRLWKNEDNQRGETELPEVTLLIAAYNEADIIAQKMQNTTELNYPGEKLHIVWITDGSDDGSPETLRKHSGIRVLHEDKRSGKTAALNRAMQFINTPFTVFCDANTLLDPEAIRELMKKFNSEKIGCVAGEKRIQKNISDSAAGSGEGAYWRYESVIKSLESKFNSVLAAAGELYAIRTELYVPVDNDIIIDDFCISLHIAKKGYRIKYAPKAFALESASANIHEELKRKVRIASGGFQAIAKMRGVLNIFRYGFFTFQFISHKVLRWAIVPFALPILLVLNILLTIDSGTSISLYSGILAAQALFYLLVLTGLIFENRTTRFKIIFLPYYLIIMNFAQITGLFRYLGKRQNAAWEKARRSSA